MGRAALKPYQGMLFVQPRTGLYRYWMHGVSIPLDILWLDSELRVLEIVCGAVPGSVEPLGSCPASKYGLEIPAGMAARYSLAVGIGSRRAEALGCRDGAHSGNSCFGPLGHRRHG